MAMLEVDNIHTYYGNIHALKGVSLSVEEGEIVTLIGANGAGKTTTLRTISGLLKPREGSVKLNGENLTPYPAHDLVSLSDHAPQAELEWRPHLRQGTAVLSQDHAETCFCSNTGQQ